MPKGNTIKFNSQAFRAILVSGGTRAAVSDVAGRMYNALDGRASVRTIIGNYGGGRVVAFVRTQPTTPEESVELRERLEGAVMGGGA